MRLIYTKYISGFNAPYFYNSSLFNIKVGHSLGSIVRDYRAEGDTRRLREDFVHCRIFGSVCALGFMMIVLRPFSRTRAEMKADVWLWLYGCAIV